MDQKRLCVLIDSLRNQTITSADFMLLKGTISNRVHISGAIKEDVVMIAIEKICYSKVKYSEYNINLFVRQRITDAYYKAGIADQQKAKVPKSNKLKIEYAPHECFTEITDASWKNQYNEAETRADMWRAFIANSSKSVPEFKAGGDLFPASPSAKY